MTTYEVTADGSWFRLYFRRASGATASITLPTECLNQLVMPMPCIAAEALRKRYPNAAMRLVYPLGDWVLARTEDDSQLILTLKTPNGFQVAFGVAASDVGRMTSTIRDHMDGVHHGI